jgi:hypothetical protein
VAEAMEASVGFTGRCSCDALARTGTDLNLDAHRPGCERRAVLLLNAAENVIGGRGDQVIIGTAPRSAEFVTGPEGGIYTCTCGAGARAAFADHAWLCPVYQLLGSRITIAKGRATGHPDSCRCEACMAFLAEREPESSGRPEKVPEPVPGIPLWDEAKHAMLAEMSGPMGLREDQLPPYDVIPPGCCSGCHLPVPDGAARCSYCSRLDQLCTDRAKAALAGKPPVAAEPAWPVADELEARRKICDHGGSRRRFVTGYPPVCTRCGEQTPAAPARQHQHPPGTSTCAACFPRRHRGGAPFFLLGLALVLFCAGTHLAAAWLCLAAIGFAAIGIHGIRKQP